jgi:hypothetical protein
MVKAALYPPACPTLIRKSRLLNPISKPLSTSPYLTATLGQDQRVWAKFAAVLGDGKMNTFGIALDVRA